MIDGLHHFHKRKYRNLSTKDSLHSAFLEKVTDTLIYLGGIFGPIATIPQLFEIWAKQDASGVSLISWTAYLVGAMFWLFYGLVHRAKPIVFTYGIWVILDIFIIIGIVLYK